MQPGSPGLGIGALFFAVSALFMPLYELVQLGLGQSRRAGRRTAFANVAIASLSVLAVQTTLLVFLLRFALTGQGTFAMVAAALALVPLGFLFGLGAVTLIVSTGKRMKGKKGPPSAETSLARIADLTSSTDVEKDVTCYLPTPREIALVPLRRSFTGYDRRETEHLVMELATSYARLWRERETLAEKVRQLSERSSDMNPSDESHLSRPQQDHQKCDQKSEGRERLAARS